jgi:hypothetical protein
MRGFSQAVPPEQLDPGDDDRGTADHRVDGFLAEPLYPLDQELDIGLHPTEIYSFGITPWHQGGDDRLACRFPTVSRLRREA